MNRFASWRLGKSSVKDIHTINKLPVGLQEIRQRFEVKCTQVPQEFEPGAYVFIWLGSDNNKGISTEWKQGFKAIGKLIKIERGSKFNEESLSIIEIVYVFSEVFNRIDILREAPVPYYFCSAFPIIGLDDHSNQTIRMFSAGEERSKLNAFFEIIKEIIPTFYNDAIKIEPKWKTLFNFKYNNPKEIKRTNYNSTEEGKIIKEPLQQIFFGAPGTGKSHTIKGVCNQYEHFRITFHPDTDYSSFVGTYKPFTHTEPLYHTIQNKGQAEALPAINPETGELITATKITYKYVFQAFLKAYVAAWKEQENEEPKPVFLVIEEINRGNCAQIFGDIFQLLDRNEEGFSDYPIHADTDLSKELRREFADLQVANATGINTLYDGKDIISEVKNGIQLLLPNNLYIWATMNTSDQSLFPIDSAFKRRWDWKYIKIADAGKGYVIKVNKNQYDWWEFLKAINDHIGTTTSQEDKKLGYFFAKATKNDKGQNVISADKFLSKVLFFLYGDVYKDYGFDDDIFKGEDGKSMEFSDYFDEEGKAIETKIEKFLRNLGLQAKDSDHEISETEDADIIDPEGADSSESDEAEYTIEEESDNYSLRKDSRATGNLVVIFSDGTFIKERYQFDTYFKALQKIGLGKAESIAAEKKYTRRNEALITKIPSQTIINDNVFSYYKSGEYYIIKGISLETQMNFLNLLSQRLELGLKVYAE